MSRQRDGIAALLLVISLSPRARAENATRASNLHVRLGICTGTIKAQTYGSSPSITNTIDLEYELGVAPTRSVYFGTTLGYDSSTAAMPYANVTAGMRFDLLGSNASYEKFTGGDTIERQLKWRAFIGPELGIAQATVQQVSGVVSVNTSLLEYGGSVGAIYQVSKNLGVELLGGLHLGYGFGNITASSSIYRIFGGVTFAL